MTSNSYYDYYDDGQNSGAIVNESNSNRKSSATMTTKALIAFGFGFPFLEETQSVYSGDVHASRISCALRAFRLPRSQETTSVSSMEARALATRHALSQEPAVCSETW